MWSSEKTLCLAASKVKVFRTNLGFMDVRVVFAVVLVLVLMVSGCVDSGDAGPGSQDVDSLNVSENVTEGENASSTDFEEESVEEEEDINQNSSTVEEDTGSEAGVGLESGQEGVDSVESSVDLGNLTTTFVDVGQGDAIVSYRDHEVLVYDTGDRFESSHGELIDYLETQDFDTIDALVVSHAHADHAGGCEAVFESFEVELFVHPGQEYDTQTWERCLTAAEEGAGEIWTGEDLELGENLDFISGVDSELVHIDHEADGMHSGDVALRHEYRDFSFLKTGDLERDVEEELLAGDLVLDSTVFSLGHHGSRTSNTEGFVEAVDPEVAVAGVGDGNQYGHPHQEVVDRMQNQGVDLFRSDVHGSVSIESDGEGYIVETTEGVEPYTSSESEGSEASSGEEEDGSVSEGVSVSAVAVDSSPCQYTDVSVEIDVRDESGDGVEGVETVSSWFYSSTTSSEEGITDESGESVHTRNIGPASTSHEVDVVVEAEGFEETGSTSFTPQSC